MEAEASDALSRAFLTDTLRSFRMYKKLGDAAMAQVVADADLLRQIDAGSNSIATVVKHIGGNLRSRFRDFLTTDGEKPDRDRDGEFEMPLDAAAPSRAEILEWWESGFAVALASIEALEPGDLTRTVYIRREPFLVVEALNRLVTHVAYHVGTNRVRRAARGGRPVDHAEHPEGAVEAVWRRLVQGRRRASADGLRLPCNEAFLPRTSFQLAFSSRQRFSTSLEHQGAMPCDEHPILLERSASWVVDWPQLHTPMTNRSATS